MRYWEFEAGVDVLQVTDWQHIAEQIFRKKPAFREEKSETDDAKHGSLEEYMESPAGDLVKEIHAIGRGRAHEEDE